MMADSIGCSDSSFFFAFDLEQMRCEWFIWVRSWIAEWILLPATVEGRSKVEPLN